MNASELWGAVTGIPIGVFLCVLTQLGLEWLRSCKQYRLERAESFRFECAERAQEQRERQAFVELQEAQAATAYKRYEAKQRAVLN